MPALASHGGAPRPLGAIPLASHQPCEDSALLELSKGSLLIFVLEQLEWVGSKQFAEVASSPSYLAEVVTQHQQRNEHIVVGPMWSSILHVCGAMSLTSMGFDMPPFSFLRPLDPDPMTKQDALKYHKRAREAMGLAEKSALEEPRRAELVTSSLVGLQKFNRKVMVLLLESDWRSALDLARSMISDFSQSWLVSLVCEEGFNTCRRMSNMHHTKRMGPHTALNVLALGSTLMGDFDRIGVGITEAARAAAGATKLPSSVFGMGKVQSSWHDRALDRLQSSSPDWPISSPSALKMDAVAWVLLVHPYGCWGAIKNAFRSLLATPATLVPNATHLAGAAHHATWILGVASANRRGEDRRLRAGALSVLPAP